MLFLKMFQVLFLRFLFLACDDCEYFLRKRNLHQMNNYLLRMCSTLKQVCHKLNTTSCASILKPLTLRFKCWWFFIFLSYWDVKCDTCPMGTKTKKSHIISMSAIELPSKLPQRKFSDLLKFHTLLKIWPCYSFIWNKAFQKNNLISFYLSEQ